MPDFRVVEITHPLSTLTQEEIKSRALEAALQIVEIITGKKSDLTIQQYGLLEQNGSPEQQNSGQPAMVGLQQNIAMQSDNGGCDDG